MNAPRGFGALAATRAVLVVIATLTCLAATARAQAPVAAPAPPVPIADSAAGVRYFGDHYDIDLYFGWSRWAVGEGRLYRDIPSEYPPLANLVFGAVRFASSGASDRGRAFYILWMLTGFAGYLTVVALAVRDRARPDLWGVLMWLAPAPLYFSLFRSDVFPALATFCALFAIRRNAVLAGALWLGIAIAFKGYALFVIPAFAYYVLARAGWGAAFRSTAVALAPFALSAAAVYALTPQAGVDTSFSYWVQRGLNGESTYDAIGFVLREPFPADFLGFNGVGRVLQAAFALAAVALRPRTFPELVNACLLALLGFVSASVWYSPQWVLWLLPFLYFADSRVVRQLSVAFAWVTYAYFPVGFDMQWRHRRAFKLAVVSVTALRLSMLWIVATAKWRRRGTPLPAQAPSP